MKIIKWTLVIFALILFNFLVVECLLKVNGLAEIFYESSLDNELKSADYIFDFSPNMKKRLLSLNLENKFDLESLEKERRISDSKVENYNPYPPILRLFRSDYVVYSKDSKLKQVTIISGESDTTPSVLVTKLRGRQTGWGDYFVKYIFYQNNITEVEGVIDADYDKIDWYSFRGGSYNGFEEAWMFVLLFLEIFILIIWSFIKKRKKI